MALFGRFLPAAGGLFVAGILGAQAAPKTTCDASVSKGALAKASFGIEQARAAQGTPAAATVLSGVVKQLEAAKGEDATVQALYLGQTLALWLSQPNEPLMARRGTLGCSAWSRRRSPAAPSSPPRIAAACRDTSTS